ncbi:S-layer protein [uncultured Lentilactobacillus sp.]|uniref:S-layer protein n=1 Tax=uncultured Lentilactobacillus sp. TaxID=2805375 RepID=UPI002597B313|nr:S-layer protein [uncultured Lentilactobacillus sp.]
MKNTLKKSLFVGVAALGLVAAVGTANATQASAKSYAKVTSNKALGGDATSRNVNFTGKSALYTKAGTLRGARVKASKAVLGSFANSKSSQHNVRAYRVATTNRGSVYYKIVSFDGAYRGWIYGGKTSGVFGGGVEQYNTTTAPAANADTSSSVNSSASINTQGQTTGLSATQKAATYKIANPGITNDGTEVTYTYPAWTQYKKGRVITDSTPYKDATFKVTDETTRTREGDLWVKIEATDAANSKAKGWILYSGLKQATPATPVDTFNADTSVKIAYRDATTGKVLDKTNTWTTASTGTKQGNAVNALVNNAGYSLTQYLVNTGAPSGYTFKTTDGKSVASNASNLTISPVITGAKFGDTLTVDVTPTAAQTKVAFYYETTSGSSIAALSASDFAYGYPAMTADQQSKALPDTKTTPSTFNVSKYFDDYDLGNNANAQFINQFKDATNSYTASAGQLTDPTTGKTTGLPKTGFFGQSLNNGTQRYFYVFDGQATKANNADLQTKGATVKVVMQRFTTTLPLPAQETNANANTDYIAK